MHFVNFFDTFNCNSDTHGIHLIYLQILLLAMGHNYRMYKVRLAHFFVDISESLCSIQTEIAYIHLRNLATRLALKLLRVVGV